MGVSKRRGIARRAQYCRGDGASAELQRFASKPAIVHSGLSWRVVHIVGGFEHVFDWLYAKHGLFLPVPAIRQCAEKTSSDVAGTPTHATDDAGLALHRWPTHHLAEDDITAQDHLFEAADDFELELLYLDTAEYRLADASHARTRFFSPHHSRGIELNWFGPGSATNRGQQKYMCKKARYGHSHQLMCSGVAGIGLVCATTVSPEYSVTPLRQGNLPDNSLILSSWLVNSVAERI